MRCARVLVALSTSCILALSGALFAVPTAAATDTTPPEVVDVVVTPAAVTVTGTAAATVSVSVHLRDPSGICTTCYVDADGMASFVGYKMPLVRIGGTTAMPGMFTLTNLTGMVRTSGAATDGWWTMSRVVTGLWAGTRPLVRIAASDTAGNVVDIDPRTAPGGLARNLTVTANDAPHISMGIVPSILPYGGHTITVKGRVYLEHSGTPLANRVILLCQDTGCGIEGSYSGVPVRTNANGYYGVTTQTQSLGLMLFKALKTTSSGTAYPSTFFTNPLYASRFVPVPRMAHYLTLSPVASTVTANHPVALHGLSELFYDTSTPVAWRSISLQRFVSGAWQTLATVLIDKATVQAGIHTYSLVLHPSARGTYQLRVLRTATPGYAPTARYLTITAV